MDADGSRPGWSMLFEGGLCSVVSSEDCPKISLTKFNSLQGRSVFISAGYLIRLGIP